MSANRYTNYTPQEYHSLFQPVNFQEILQLGLLKEKQYEEGQIASEDFLTDLYKRKSLEADDPKRREKLKFYEDFLNKTLDENKSDYSKMIPKVRSLKRQFLRDESLNDMQAKYDDLELKKKEFKDNVKNYEGNENMVYNLKIQKALENYKGQEEVAPGVFNKINYGLLPTYPDIQKEMSDMYKDFNATAFDLGFKDMGNGYYRSATGEKVDARTVKQAVQSSIMTNPKYSPFLKDLSDYYGKDAANNYAAGIVQGIVNREAGSKLNVDYNKNWVLEKEMDKQPVLPGQISQGMYDVVSENPVLKEAQGFFGKNGELLTQKSIESDSPSGGSYDVGNESLSGGKINRNSDSFVENKTYLEQKSIIDNYRKNAPNSTKGLSDKQVLDLHIATANSSGNIAYNSISLPNTNSEALTKSVIKDLSGKKIKITGDESVSTLPEVAKKLGLSKDNLAEQIKNSYINGIKPLSKNNPGSFKVTIYNSQSVPVEITIPGSTDQQSFFKEYNDLMTYDIQGQSGSVTTDNYHAVTSMGEQNVNGVYQPVYGTIIYPLSTGKTTLKEINDKFGSVDIAKSKGYEFIKHGDIYKLLLNPETPDEVGRKFVGDWEQIGLKQFSK